MKGEGAFKKVVITHPNADFDAFASMVAVFLMEKEVVFTFPGGMERALRRFLKSKLFEPPIVAPKAISLEEVTHLFLVDSQELDHLDIFAPLVLKERVPCTIYDHHPQLSLSQFPPHTQVIHAPYGSCTTLMVQLLKKKGIPLPSLEASILLMGIHEDTGHLLFAETTPEDHEACAFLLKRGADLRLLRRFIQQELKPKQIRWLDQMHQNAEFYTLQGFRIVFTSLTLPAFEEDMAFIVHRFLDTLDCDMVFAFLVLEGKIYLIARSRHPDGSVQEVLEALGGGGHPSAGSAVLKNLTPLEARQKVITLLKKYLPSRLTLGDIAAFPIHMVSHTVKVKEAHQTLNALRINACPIKDDKNQVIGRITRQLLDHALHHGLKDHPVTQIMLPPPPVLPPDTPIEKALPQMQKSHGRFILVGSKEKPEGLITRMDLLRHLYTVFFEKPYDERKFQRMHPSRMKVTRWLKQNLAPKGYELLKFLGKAAESLKMKAYLVGGCVRDLFLGFPMEDLDVVVEGDAIALGEALVERWGGKLRTHAKFLTAKWFKEPSFHVDLATARTETYHQIAALPEVRSSPLRQDLYRRDFTINTMAIALNPDHFGEMIDFFGGYQDLKSRHIRVLHSLSFIDDPTRAFRAVQFKVRLDFRIASETERLIKLAVAEGVVSRLSGTRLWEELKSLLILPNRLQALEALEDLGLLKAIHPHLKVNLPLRDRLEKLMRVLHWAMEAHLPPCPQAFLLLLVLLEPLPVQELPVMADRFHFMGKERRWLLYHRHIKKKVETALRESHKPSEVYAVLESLDVPILYYILGTLEEEDLKEKVRNYLTRWQKVHLTIRGRDLLQKGAAPGPSMGKALRETLLAKLDGKVKTPQDELAYAMHYLATLEKTS